MTHMHSITRIIDISTPKHPNSFAIVDCVNYEKLAAHKWHIDFCGVVVRMAYRDDWRSGKTKIQMHRDILGFASKSKIDHINGNQLDCRVENLRKGRRCPKITPEYIKPASGSRYINLSTSKYKNVFTIIDDCSHSELSKYSWCMNKHGYAVRGGIGGGLIFMHRDILGIGKLRDNPHIFCDHINGDRLDNRASNLRIVTIQQNSVNSAGWGKSGIKGVFLCKRSNRFFAQITISGKTTRSSAFTNIDDAALWYEKQSEKLHGDFACTRHIGNKEY